MIDTAGGSTSDSAGAGAIPPSPAPHLVHLACPCPGTPHAYDVVTLRRRPTIPMGAAVATVTRNPTNQAQMEAALSLIYMGYGIEAWTFLDKDEQGASVPVWISEPVERDLLERWLPFAGGGLEVMEAADQLYSEEVFRRFRERSRTRLPSGPEAPSTSPMTDSGRTPRKHSKRSSRASSAGRPSAV